MSVSRVAAEQVVRIDVIAPTATVTTVQVFNYTRVR